MSRFEALKTLLELERRASAERTRADLDRLTAHEAERAGYSLIDLVALDEAPSLGGLTVLTLRKRNRTLDLPRGRMQPGDPVLLTAEGWELGGVVTAKDRETIKVAVRDDAGSVDLEGTFRLDLSSDEVTTRREARGLDRVEAATKNRLARLRDVFDKKRPPVFEATAAPAPGRLDPTQEEAVRFALSADDVALIHGPPGTGKTATVVELIVRAVAAKEKVLVTAPSNLAVDNVVERLVPRGVNVVRLGHPARVMPEVVDRTLSALVEASEEVRLARRLVKEALALRRQAEKRTRAAPPKGLRSELREDARVLFADARKMEARAVERILDSAEVVAATCTFDDEVLKGRRFDRVIVDEACQATEPATWLPILHGEKVVLAGDHLQLPPTIISPEAAAAGLGVSLFERIVATQGNSVTRRLGVQYRMHAAIMGYSSQALYGGGIIAADSVSAHVLADLPGVIRSPLTETPLAFVDTAGAGHSEVVEADGESRANPEEAAAVAQLVERLSLDGVRAEHIGVITPYAAQARALRALLDPGIEVDTVDGFQGREKEAILISLVRSNDEAEIGFLSDVRRMNVALTRARRKLIVVGNGATLSPHPFYRSMIDWFEAAGAYTTIWELT